MVKTGDNIEISTRPQRRGKFQARVVASCYLNLSDGPEMTVEQMLQEDGVFQVALVEYERDEGTYRSALIRLGDGWRDTRGRALFIDPVS